MNLETIKELALSKKLTLGTVESITGGSIAAALTSIPGASSFFKGSLVTYKNEIKHQVAKIKLSQLKKYGSISKEVGLSLAEQGKKILHVDICLSITGNAGPQPIEDKPVGEVFITVIGPNIVKQEYFLFAGDREAIRKQAVEEGLIMIEKMLMIANVGS
jgi:PncC family amidohydrolase